MLESTLVTMGWAVSNWLIAGVRAAADGQREHDREPVRHVPRRDGLLNIAANKQEQFETLCRLIGREELIAHPQFAEREERKRNRFELKAEIETALAATPGRGMGRAPERERRSGRRSARRARGARTSAGGGTAASCARSTPCPASIVRCASCAAGFRLASGDPEPKTPPPALGADTADILGELGFSQQDVEEFRRESAI